MLRPEEERARLAERSTSLHVMAEQTDGVGVTATNDLALGLRRMTTDLSAYYLLGYYSTGKLDGRFHAITVRATRWTCASPEILRFGRMRTNIGCRERGQSTARSPGERGPRPGRNSHVVPIGQDLALSGGGSCQWQDSGDDQRGDFDQNNERSRGPELHCRLFRLHLGAPPVSPADTQKWGRSGAIGRIGLRYTRARLGGTL